MGLHRTCAPGIVRAASAPSLVAATSLASGAEGAVSSTIVSGSISPAGNALLVCSLGARSDGEADVTALAPSVSGLSLVGSWELVQARILGATRYVGCCIAMARTAASPGTGTITFNWDGDAWNKSYAINQVAAGFGTDLTAYPRVTSQDTSTSLALNLTLGPAASSLIFSALAHEASNAAAPGVPSGLTLLNDVPQAANLELWDAQKLGGGAQNNSWGSLDTGEGDAGVLVEILQLAA